MNTYRQVMPLAQWQAVDLLQGLFEIPTDERRINEAMVYIDQNVGDSHTDCESLTIASCGRVHDGRGQ